MPTPFVFRVSHLNCQHIQFQYILHLNIQPVRVNLPISTQVDHSRACASMSVLIAVVNARYRVRGVCPHLPQCTGWCKRQTPGDTSSNKISELRAENYLSLSRVLSLATILAWCYTPTDGRLDLNSISILISPTLPFLECLFQMKIPMLNYYFSNFNPNFNFFTFKISI